MDNNTPILDDYPPHFAGLFTAGDAGFGAERTDQCAEPFGAKDIPALVRMVKDRRLNLESKVPYCFAPIHALRILGDLKAHEAIIPAISLLDLRENDVDDYAANICPRVLAKIGPVALPHLRLYLADSSKYLFSRLAASDAIAKISQRHPERREECIALVEEHLRSFRKNDPDFNTGLIGSLLDMKAVESAALIEQVYESGRVELFVNGDWEEVQIELGLITFRTTPRRNFMLESLLKDDPAPALASSRNRAKRDRKKRKRGK